VQRPYAAERKGQKNWQQNEYIKLKNLILCTQKKFKLLSQINQKSINNSSFFKVCHFCHGQPLLLLTPGIEKPSHIIHNFTIHACHKTSSGKVSVS